MGVSRLVWLAVGLAGAMGALLRFYSELGASWLLGEPSPWGTLGVNIIGCLALGCLGQIFVMKRNLPAWVAPALGTGFIGSFTTFSTFSMDMVLWISEGRWLAAALYLLCSMAGGMVAVWLGWRAAEVRLTAGGREKGRGNDH